jgi:hypothetical protein
MCRAHFFFRVHFIVHPPLLLHPDRRSPSFSFRTRVQAQPAHVHGKIVYCLRIEFWFTRLTPTRAPSRSSSSPVPSSPSLSSTSERVPGTNVSLRTRSLFFSSALSHNDYTCRNLVLIVNFYSNAALGSNYPHPLPNPTLATPPPFYSSFASVWHAYQFLGYCHDLS